MFAIACRPRLSSIGVCLPASLCAREFPGVRRSPVIFQAVTWTCPGGGLLSCILITPTRLRAVGYSVVLQDVLTIGRRERPASLWHFKYVTSLIINYAKCRWQAMSRAGSRHRSCIDLMLALVVGVRRPTQRSGDEGVEPASDRGTAVTTSGPARQRRRHISRRDIQRWNRHRWEVDDTARDTYLHACTDREHIGRSGPIRRRRGVAQHAYRVTNDVSLRNYFHRRRITACAVACDMHRKRDRKREL